MKNKITTLLCTLATALAIPATSLAFCSVTRYGQFCDDGNGNYCKILVYEAGGGSQICYGPDYPVQIPSDGHLDQNPANPPNQDGSTDYSACEYPKHLCSSGACEYACR